MKDKSHITYKQLLEIVSWGIFSMDMKGNSVYDERLYKIKNIEGASYGGIYVGSPGRDIYYMLPFLREEEMKEVAILLCSKFPKYPPNSYVNVAACIRFIYGQFEKQGVLKSEEELKKMKESKIDWSLPRKFLKLLYNEMKENDNFYGLVMLCEMEGHRLGDEAVINKDKIKLDEMEKKYNESVKYAYKCGSYKHMFSIYYWMGKYFKEFGETDKAVKYFKLSIIKASKYYRKYFIKGDQYYSKRLSNSFDYIKKYDIDNWENFKKKYKKNIKNRFKKED